MKYWKAYERSLRIFGASVLLVAVLLLAFGGMGGQKLYLPLLTYVLYENDRSAGPLGESLTGFLPICGYARDMGAASGTGPETGGILFAEQEEEAEKEDPSGGTGESVSGDDAGVGKKTGDGTRPGEYAGEWEDALSLQELVRQENAVDQGGFTPAGRVYEYDWAAMEDYETLLSTFYAIDANALAGSDLFQLSALRDRDMRLDRTAPGPQILIYHTHSREAFADSQPGEQSQTVVGVGEFLAWILTEEYGYEVLHVTEEYDTVRDDAYAVSLPALERILEENPSIQVVIDLHRDAGSASRDMVTEVDGRPTARFMFFNGISRSRTTGEISYLQNPNLAGNLAFSFQLQEKAGEYYPGLTRKIYVREYRYNMHLRERSLLIELGDENNTLEEAMNACYPLAHILDMVLSGEE